MRFPILFEPLYGVVSSLLLLRPADSYLEIVGDGVECRMGWAFRTKFPLAVVTRASRLDVKPLSRGVHGLAGRWLVNGAGTPILAIDLEPSQRAWVLGIPVRLRQLLVSVGDPDGLIWHLTRVSRDLSRTEFEPRAP